MIAGAGFSGTALAIRLDRALVPGLEITADGRPVDRDGTAVDRWYLGPWLRARAWEATALSELRDKAARLAQRILPLTGAAARTP